MKKEKPEPKVNAAAGNFVNAVQTGLTEMNKRLQDMEQKVQEKDKLLNDMAMALKSQQDVLVNTPPQEVPGSEAERNQPMTKGDFFQIIKDGIQLTKAVFISRQICAQNCVAFSEPTGKYETRISAPVSLMASLIS